jgi:hypothetical protein
MNNITSVLKILKLKVTPNHELHIIQREFAVKLIVDNLERVVSLESKLFLWL